MRLLEAAIPSHASKGVLVCGWPLRSVWCEYRFDKQSSTTRDGAIVHQATGALNLPGWPWNQAAWRVSSGTYICKALPLLPLWPGLVVNAVVYALALGTTHRGFDYARRLARRRKGACIQCGYPMGGTMRCPECGLRA